MGNPESEGRSGPCDGDLEDRKLNRSRRLQVTPLRDREDQAGLNLGRIVIEDVMDAMGCGVNEKEKKERGGGQREEALCRAILSREFHRSPLRNAALSKLCLRPKSSIRIGPILKDENGRKRVSPASRVMVYSFLLFLEG